MSGGNSAQALESVCKIQEKMPGKSERSVAIVESQSIKKSLFTVTKHDMRCLKGEKEKKTQYVIESTNLFTQKRLEVLC